MHSQLLQAKSERQDSTCTYLAHHELESVILTTIIKTATGLGRALLVQQLSGKGWGKGKIGAARGGGGWEGGKVQGKELG